MRSRDNTQTDTGPQRGTDQDSPSTDRSAGPGGPDKSSLQRQNSYSDRSAGPGGPDRSSLQRQNSYCDRSAGPGGPDRSSLQRQNSYSRSEMWSRLCIYIVSANDKCAYYKYVTMLY